MDLNAIIARLAGEYPGNHSSAYETKLFFGSAEEDVEQQMMDWRLSIDLPPGSGLAIWSRDEWISETTILRYVAYEPREQYEEREALT